MSLEKSGYTKAKYRKKIYRIFSEINYNDYTIELLDGNNIPFTVRVCDIKLMKVILKDNKS